MFATTPGIALVSALLTLGVSGGFASAAAAGEKLPFAREVDSCLAAVNSRLDLDRAKRVRHLVSNAKSTGIGYVLTIETAVIFADTEKNYEARCVANGSNVPLKLRVEQTGI
jgi:hypothetical protein